MDNQHRLISGYRELPEHDIVIMNEIKHEGERLRLLIERLHAMDDAPDQRWMSMGKSQLQLGIMCLIRAVAKPTGF